MSSPKRPVVIELIDALSSKLAKLTDFLVVLLASLLMAALILQVFFRYVIGESLVWSEELALTVFTWTILLAATTALRDGAHVRLDLVILLLPPRVRTVWTMVLNLVILVFCVAFAWSGYDYTQATLGQVSPALQLPIELLHLAAPVCGVLGAIHALARLVGTYNSDQQELIG